MRGRQYIVGKRGDGPGHRRRCHAARLSGIKRRTGGGKMRRFAADAGGFGAVYTRPCLGYSRSARRPNRHKGHRLGRRYAVVRVRLLCLLAPGVARRADQLSAHFVRRTGQLPRLPSQRQRAKHGFLKRRQHHGSGLGRQRGGAFFSFCLVWTRQKPHLSVQVRLLASAGCKARGAGRPAIRCAGRSRAAGRLMPGHPAREMHYK